MSIISAFVALLSILVSVVDCDKTLLALELVIDLSPMLDAIAEPLALLDSLEEG